MLHHNKGEQYLVSRLHNGSAVLSDTYGLHNVTKGQLATQGCLNHNVNQRQRLQHIGSVTFLLKGAQVGFERHYF